MNSNDITQENNNQVKKAIIVSGFQNCFKKKVKTTEKPDEKIEEQKTDIFMFSGSFKLGYIIKKDHF